jgi:endonuclease/exonuclease/phosphatase family metal-dependent hydrolase
MNEGKRKRKLTLTKGAVRCLWRASFIATVAAALIGVGAPFTTSADSQRFVTVMTRNVDEGTDLDFILAAGSFDELLVAVAETYQEVVDSNIPERAAALAREIRDAQPDVVGLQEVTQWRTGPLGGPADNVAFDLLQSLLDELDGLGLHYEAVAVVDDFDFELPSALGIDVARTDRDVLLARTDLKTSGFKLVNVQARVFDTKLEIDTLFGHIVVPAGWISADVKIRGKQFRIVTTHLDNLAPPVRLAQAGELLQGPANTELPVVLIGDFNSDAGSIYPDLNGAYLLLRSSGFWDAWAKVHPGDPGFTWPLHDEDPFTPSSTPNQRIDLVLFRGLDRPLSAQLIGNETSDLTPSGLWPSDHAGLVVTLRLK